MKLEIKRSPFNRDGFPLSLKLNDSTYLYLEDDSLFNNKFEFVTKDDEIKLFNDNFVLATKKNDSDAQLICGICYYYSYGVDTDKKESLKMFKKSYENGNIYGELYYAWFLENEKLDECNKTAAVEIYKDLFYKNQYYVTGRAYQSLLSLKEYCNFIEIYKSALLMSDPFLFLVIGYNSQNDEEKINLYYTSCDLFCNYAYYMLGLGFYYYATTNNKEEKAIEYFNKSTLDGDYIGFVEIAKIFDSKKQFEKAFNYYCKAYELGDREESLWQMAYYYKEGLGVKQDINKALCLFTQYKHKSSGFNNEFINEQINECTNILNK